MNGWVKYLSLRLREFFRDYFTGRNDFDSTYFLEDWESKYGKLHDPSPEEIFHRISFLVPTGETICELGAGYGRVAQHFTNSHKLILVEPDKKLCQILTEKIPNSEIINATCLSVAEIDSDFFFSVRALEYASILELFRMFKLLKKNATVL